MLNPFLSRITITLFKSSVDLYPPLKSLIVLVLLVFNGGCSEPPSSSVELSVNAEPTEELGQYNVSGTTSLPEGSQIAVMAIRPIAIASPSIDPDPEETYSILDRNFARVEAGKWQTQLDLWQTHSDGRLREVWQIQDALSTQTTEPEPNVTFIALFEPSHQSEELKEQLQVQGPPSSELLVQLPTQGTWYLRATQTLDVPLPTARQTPPKESPVDVNDGWGDRSVLKPQPTEPGILDVPSDPLRTTNAPLSREEFMH